MRSRPRAPRRPSNQYIAANVTAGSATLVPLMAVEMEANHAAAVDAPAGGGGGQSDDDIAFVRQATENARKEVQSARDALLQLKNPELIRSRRNAGERSQRRECNACRRSPRPNNGRYPLRRLQTAPPSGTASSDFDAKWTAEMIAGHERSMSAVQRRGAGRRGPGRCASTRATRCRPSSTIWLNFGDCRNDQRGEQNADHEDHQTAWVSQASRSWPPRSWRRVRSAATRKSGAGSTSASRRNVGKVKAAPAAPALLRRAP